MSKDSKIDGYLISDGCRPFKTAEEAFAYIDKHKKLNAKVAAVTFVERPVPPRPTAKIGATAVEWRGNVLSHTTRVSECFICTAEGIRIAHQLLLDTEAWERQYGGAT